MLRAHQFSGSALHRILFPRKHYLPGALQPNTWALLATDFHVKYASSAVGETQRKQRPSGMRRLVSRDLLPCSSVIPVFALRG